MKDDLNQMIPEHVRREIEAIYRKSKQPPPVGVAESWWYWAGWHRWSKWWTVRKGNVLHYVEQKRICVRCNLVKMREERV